LLQNISYDSLYDLVNNHRTFRRIFGIENIWGMMSLKKEEEALLLKTDKQ